MVTCRKCGAKGTCRTIEVRERNDFIYRARICTKCGYRFITHESFYRESCSYEKNARLVEPERISSGRRLWLQVKDGDISQVEIASVNGNKVVTASGDSMSLDSYKILWRLWNRKPNYGKQMTNFDDVQSGNHDTMG